ncbi:hypothetical protein PHMEG_0006801 [Phytophthora megakarya]|uniref:Uncharacterized protein n=1 Tax=Phytophthora megakarya TaxID=4795 RepID=A0A225WN10_9STRA|nr:hypothetical protein PHMEG_0006801 [Phytophthora megakarya]
MLHLDHVDFEALLEQKKADEKVAKLKAAAKAARRGSSTAAAKPKAATKATQAVKTKAKSSVKNKTAAKATQRQTANASEDVNYAKPTEASQAFVTFESDAENDDGDNKDSAGEGVEANDVRLPVPPEMRFDADLVTAIGGMTNIAADEVSDAILTKMGQDG